MGVFMRRGLSSFLVGASLVGCGDERAASDAAMGMDAAAEPVASSDAAVSGGDGGLFLAFDGGLERAQRCDKSSDCAWVQSSCACLYLTLQDVTAIREDFIDRVTLSCDQRCSTLPAPYLIPRCESGRCEVIDLGQRPESECATVGDCSLRVRECCECGGNTAVDAVIALPHGSFSAYQALVCDEPAPTCDACLPSYPPTEGLGLIAQMQCRDGHCTAEAVRVEPQ
jgi:hypothetical protein